MLRRRLLGGRRYKYVTGAVSCSAGNAFNNYVTGSNYFRIKINFRINQSGTTIYLVHNWRGATNNWSLLLNNGALTYQETYESTTTNYTWTHKTIETGKWYSVEIYFTYYNGSKNRVYCVLDGTNLGYSQQNANMYTSSAARNVYLAYGVNGDNSVSLRGEIHLSGTSYNSSTTSNSATWNLEDETVGSSLGLTNNGYTITGGTVYLGTE